MLQKTRLALASLCIYRNILDDPVIKAWVDTLDATLADNIPIIEQVEKYHNFIFELYKTGHSYKEHIYDLILHDDNPFSQAAEQHAYREINSLLIAAVRRDLQMLTMVVEFNPQLLVSQLGSMVAGSEHFFTGLEGFDQPAGDKKACLAVETLAKHYAENSRGIVSRYKGFRWDQGLVGVPNPDPARLSDLIGCEAQKRRVCENTEAFLQGYPANNILLYGSRGTGKSTMVKALLNQYSSRGLRLVEVGRNHLNSLPEVVSHLRQYCPRFIIFIDDLSFEDYETEYKGLKAVMEGSLEARPDNVLIYATSNRRHLVKEYFSDRGKPTDEIHSGDTMQEKLSLADRFGLTITFPTPGQQVYLEIVENMAASRNINMDPQLLCRMALEWERVHHGPSGRTARQFIDSLGTYNI